MHSSHKIFGVYRQYFQRCTWSRFRWPELGSGAAADQAAVEIYVGLEETFRTSPHSTRSVTMKFSPILGPYTLDYRDGVRRTTTEGRVRARGTTHGVGMGVGP